MPPASSRRCFPARPRSSITGCAWRIAGGHVAEIDDPYRYGRVITEYDVYCSRRARTADLRQARRAPHADRRGRRRALRRLGAQRRPRQHRRRLQRDGTAASIRCGGCGPTGVWEIFLPGVPDGERYKFEIRSSVHGELLLKTDPFGFAFEVPPLTASIVARRCARLARRAVVRRSRRQPRLAEQADGDLRGPSRLVGAGAGGARSLSHLSPSSPRG